MSQYIFVVFQELKSRQYHGIAMVHVQKSLTWSQPLAHKCCSFQYVTQSWPGQKSDLSRQELCLCSCNHLIYWDKPHLWVTPLTNTRILINKKRLQLTTSQIKLSGQMCLLLNSLSEIITTGCQPSTVIDMARDCLHSQKKRNTIWTFKDLKKPVLHQSSSTGKWNKRVSVHYVYNQV